MDLSPLPRVESPYVEFTHDPYSRLHEELVEIEDVECDYTDYLLRSPMTMEYHDGSVLYENEHYRLLETIVDLDDVETLERYLNIAPRAIPSIWDIRYENLSLYEVCNYYLLAAVRGNLRVLQMLLARSTKPVDPTEQIRFKKRGVEMMNYAARWGCFEIVKFLLDSQAFNTSIHDLDYLGYTALASAADIYGTRDSDPLRREEVFPENNEAVMHLLLDRGAHASDIILPPNNRQGTSDTVLTLAAQWAGRDLIKRLIDCGADIHACIIQDPWMERRPSGWDYISDVNALFVACKHANLAGVKTLLECCNSADIDLVCYRDGRGSLPLHWAARNHLHEEARDIPIEERVQNITQVIEILLDIAPSTINTQDHDGNTPLHYVAEFFSRQGEQHTAIFEFLCSRGADSSIRNKKGKTPLHTLFSSNRFIEAGTGVIPVLISYGAEANDVDDAGNTSLHTAARNLLHLGAVSSLLEQGADAALRDAKQNSSVHIAAYGYGILRANGTRLPVDEKIRWQNDMLERMVEAGGIEMMSMLNAEGKTPLDICRERRDEWRNDSDVGKR
jgi:ankyrin repeat protein